jgi:predicted benzoate:H+ symporter BenE
MRKLVLALASLALLSACASTLQNAYDERAREQCEEENHGPDRLNCR